MDPMQLKVVSFPIYMTGRVLQKSMAPEETQIFFQKSVKVKKLQYLSLSIIGFSRVNSVIHIECDYNLFATRSSFG